MLTAADLIWGPSAAARALETRHVRTPAGAKRYGLPIGSPIEAASKAAGKGAKAAAGAGRALSHEDVVAHAHTLSDEDLARLHEAIAELHHGRQAKAAVVAHAPGAEHGGSVEGRIHAAYKDLVKAPGALAALADVREHPAVAGTPRHEVDAALHRLAMAPDAYQHGVRVFPAANTKALSPRDRAAAVQIGGEASHALAIGASYRPPSHALGGAPGTARAVSVSRTPPDISRHVTALEGHRSRLQPGNLHAPVEAARTHLADVKGAELNALAKHYGHGTAGTAAQKRQRILQAAVGRQADSLAIQHAALRPAAPPDLKQIARTEGIGHANDLGVSQTIDRADERLKRGAPPSEVARMLRGAADAHAEEGQHLRGEDTPEINANRMDVRILRRLADAIEKAGRGSS